MANKFPSLSNFLNNAKKLERSSLERSIDNTEQEVQKILNESAVRLSVYNNLDSTESDRTSEFIQQSIKEAVELNKDRFKSILDELFSDNSISKEREDFWINKLCNLFNISTDLPIEDQKILIEKRLSEDDDSLSFVQYMMEAQNRNST